EGHRSHIADQPRPLFVTTTFYEAADPSASKSQQALDSATELLGQTPQLTPTRAGSHLQRLRAEAPHVRFALRLVLWFSRQSCARPCSAGAETAGSAGTSGVPRTR